MNWLGDSIQKHVRRNDIVLDLGCGIMQATSDTMSSGSLSCSTILGVDIVEKYIDVIKKKYPTIVCSVTNTSIFSDRSFDVVLCIDVLEHLDLKDALYLISEMKRIARRSVIVYTPREFHSNEENEDDAWGMGSNPYQLHRCVLDEDTLMSLGFFVSHPVKYSRKGIIKIKSSEQSENFAVWYAGEP